MALLKKKREPEVEPVAETPSAEPEIVIGSAVSATLDDGTVVEAVVVDDFGEQTEASLTHIGSRPIRAKRWAIKLATGELAFTDTIEPHH
ncbi:hypothetical protein [Gordonia hankookensis]|uniref:Uncharacterized protein n=1 Tax=Gordonia hankookensis TaxID=589403 RepID=A0ABR7WC20_9ACTN|nr:hypothetical protein [Gordonia hankookensis]MBD1320333.1 hypothetical protein [Gordonia hankookensis]NDZ97293.1 hypothetical protein [Streptomyces sp. SID11726]NEB26329.1 hypothetical protein [Streptomyces sp. SID6673]NED60126.1 hypothetical protein [Streptomyces sp. SID10244]